MMSFLKCGLAGLLMAEDKAFAVEVVSDETTANAEDFTVENLQTFTLASWKII